MYPERPFYFAHRGGNEIAPENTLSSFLAAYKGGCRYLELDLQATRDGQLVVFHDNSLKRMLGVNRRFSELDFQSLRSLRYQSGEPILTFEALLQEMPPDTKLNIDPKSDLAASQLVSVLERHPALNERLAIGTFSTSRITWIRSRMPDVTTVASRNEVIIAFSRYLAGKSLNLPAKALQIPLASYFRPHLRAEFAEYLHEQGLQVHVWTVNYIEDMHMLFARGFDAIMTDKPSLAQTYFDTRLGK